MGTSGRRSAMRLLVPTLAALTIAACSTLLAAPARGADSTQVPYLLQPGSDFEVGCFGPCACPILYQLPMKGSFVLESDGSDPLYQHYKVLSVDWQVQSGDSVMHVHGSGTYK